MFNCKISPGYFLDEMQMFEIAPLIDRYNKEYQNTWEQTRFGSFITACSMGAKMDEPKDLVRFSWEKEEKKEKPTDQQLQTMRESMYASLVAAQEGKGEIVRV